jgi:hypothetical protein
MKRKWLRRSVMALLVLGTVVALFYAEENWRGAHAWEKVEAELKAKGEPLTMEEMIPLPIPDDENKAMAPLFIEVFAADKEASDGKKDVPPTTIKRLREVVYSEDLKPKKNSNPGRGESFELSDPKGILDYFSQHAKEMENIEEALGRPRVRWNLDYTKGFEMRFPHLNAALDIAKILQLRAQAHIRLGQDTEAIKDIHLILRSGDLVRRDNYLIGHLVSITCDSIAQQLIWEGMQRRLWNEAQLRELQKLEQRTDYVDNLQHAMRWERAVFLDIVSRMKVEDLVRLTGASDTTRSRGFEERIFLLLVSLRPKGWLDQERVYCCQIHESAFFQSSAPPELIANTKTTFKKLMQDFAFIPNLFYRPLTKLAMPSIEGSLNKTFNTMAGFGMINASAAIERHRLATGKLPQNLEALIPVYLDTMPLDPVDGKPLRYVIKNENDYLLYSIGWNETDDGGVATKNRDQGDWVWPSCPGLVEVREK